MKKPWLPPVSFREYVAALVDYCSGITFQGEYRIRTYWMSERAPDEDSDSDTCASISIDHVYLQIALSVYPALVQRWRDRKYETCGGVILHELCHGFIKPIQALWQWDDCQSQKKANQEVIERQTQRIANAIADVLPENWFEPAVVIPKMSKVKANRMKS